MRNRAVLKSLILVAFIFCGFFQKSVSQTCSSCSENTSNTQAAGTLASPTGVSNNNTGWSSNFPTSTGIARFQNSGVYRWVAGGNNSVSISGIILEVGVTLILDRSNDGIFEAFDIVGGCIVVKSGAVLDFRYFTSLENVSICVEDGGTVRFDSRRGDGGVRDDFVFDNVIIDLKGDDAIIELDDADLKIEDGGLSIVGWSGSAVCSGTPPVPPASGTSGNISWTGNTVNICDLLNFSVLPVEYIYFNSSFDPGNRNAQLSWATSKEWENSHFEIERSQNGAKTWEKVGRMEGRGWSDMPVGYEFLDEELPLVGGNVFYRLKQVDFNGSFAYSKVVSVKVPSLQLTKGVWRVYPNPTTGEKFRIDLLNPKAYQGEKIQVRLVTSTAGDKIFTGNDIREISLQLEEVFNRAYKGVYILEISWGQKIEHIKVLRQ